MTPVRTAAIRAMLLESIRDEPRVRTHRRRRRVLAWSGAFVFAAGATALGATVLLDAADVSELSIVHCYSSTIPRADGSFPGSSASITEGDAAGRVDDALPVCTALWEQGVLVGDFKATSPSNAPGEVPSLEICVMGDGSAAIVPGDSSAVCQSVGLAPLRG